MTKGTIPPGQWSPKGARIDKTGKLVMPKAPVKVRVIRLGPRG